ncbi:MAG: hypothetical protein JNM79_06885 [Burkholderiales bacterium]|nr:hypothetical protein [Burkholderiales bacterium]
MRGGSTAASAELNHTDRIACLWAAFSCWSLSVLFIIGWGWTSRVDNGAWVGVPAATFIVEFFLLHSSAFFFAAFNASTSFRVVASMLLLAVVYGSAIAAFAYSYGSWWVLAYGLGEIAGRIVGMVRRSEFDVARAGERSAIGFIIFLALAILVLALAPPFPRGGVTPELIAKFCPGTRECGMTGPLQNAHAFMVTYFFLLGIVELWPLFARPRVEH